jgi:ketosteroid isomerase-like protein
MPPRYPEARTGTLQGLREQRRRCAGRIFADDLVYFHSNGLSDPKSAVLQSFASRELKISRFDGEEVQARQIGDVMVATGLVHVDLVNKGNAAKFDIRYTVIYVNQGGQWRLIHVQNARVPAKS